MSNIITIQALTKRYGQLTALDNLTLDVEEGAVVGFIGPNGAGKTTTMRILTTLLSPSSGEASVAGYSVTEEPQGVRGSIGYMPDFFGVYEDMKVWEYLDFFAACYNVQETVRHGMIGDLLDLVDLGHKRDEYVENLSRGMKQRLCLARTLTHDPKVLILDEPASGLDPRARIEMRELLRELKNMGKTIFFSSHILSEIADVCTHIAILEAGRLVAYGDMAEMKKQLRPHRLFIVRILGDTKVIQETLVETDKVLGIVPVQETDPESRTVRFEFTGDDREVSLLLATLVKKEVPIISFAQESNDLEDVFMHVTRGIVH
ncbi:MAG TPA: ABC transporter ATP-binding protein [Patescibacteria group bacterium]|jgi:ABC-2 type transport system ATP-binding protein|nr:ABC transporter ATP-binding protein [Patescibacteria group bacterium]